MEPPSLQNGRGAKMEGVGVLLVHEISAHTYFPGYFLPRSLKKDAIVAKSIPINALGIATKNQGISFTKLFIKTRKMVKPSPT